jgi:membrane protein
MGVADIPARVRAFFSTRIWTVQLAGLPAHRAVAYHAARVLHSTVLGFFENRLTMRAAALTYWSALSVVPFLAFAFAVLKGFGAYRSFVEGAVRPYLRGTFEGNPALLGAIERILGFVEQTDVSRLGTLALLFLVYTSVSLLSGVEEQLNVLFGARSSRSLLRQLTDYTTLLVIAPILLVVATAVSAAAQSSDLVAFLRGLSGLGLLVDLAVGLAPVAFIGVALFALYVILPNVRIRPVSALLGAGVAALLWQGALVLHVRSQVGVASYNALYSGLAAIPIFLVWSYVSWLVVLVGAQLAASHHGERVARQRFRMRRTDPALREVLAVALGAVITRDFLEGGPRRGAAALAELVEVPPQLVEEVLDALARAGLVVRAVVGLEGTYVPGGDVDRIRADDLRQALRRDPAADEVRAAVAGALGDGLAPVLRAVGDGRGALGGLTLRELAERVGEPPDVAAAAADDAPGQVGTVADPEDPKEPGLPH